MVLTVSFVLSPVIGLVCHRRLRIWRGKIRLGSHTSANLTPASRRQNHTTSPSAESIVRRRAIRQLTGLIDPPCHPLTSPDALASTASRPALVTTRDRPSDRNETVMDMHLIWVSRERKYFSQRDWTRGSRKRASDLRVRQNQWTRRMG